MGLDLITAGVQEWMAQNYRYSVCAWLCECCVIREGTAHAGVTQQSPDHQIPIKLNLHEYGQLAAHHIRYDSCQDCRSKQLICLKIRHIPYVHGQMAMHAAPLLTYAKLRHWLAAHTDHCCSV